MNSGQRRNIVLCKEASDESSDKVQGSSNHQGMNREVIHRRARNDRWWRLLRKRTDGVPGCISEDAELACTHIDQEKISNHHLGWQQKKWPHRTLVRRWALRSLVQLLGSCPQLLSGRRLLELASILWHRRARVSGVVLGLSLHRRL